VKYVADRGEPGWQYFIMSYSKAGYSQQQIHSPEAYLRRDGGDFRVVTDDLA
jgi:hypothetical protein